MAESARIETITADESTAPVNEAPEVTGDSPDVVATAVDEVPEVQTTGSKGAKGRGSAH